jgi:hypothetical protein
VLYALLTREGPEPASIDRFDAGLSAEPDDSPLLDMDDEQLQTRAAALVAGRL